MTSTVKFSDALAAASIRKGLEASVEASDIGLRPGQFPERIAVEGDGRPAAWMRQQKALRGLEGDVMAVQYVSDATGAVLVVWND